MARSTRIPKAELTGVYGAMIKRMSRKMLGDVPSNGMPGARIDSGGTATAVSLVVEDGRITRIYAMRKSAQAGMAGKVADPRR